MFFEDEDQSMGSAPTTDTEEGEGAGETDEVKPEGEEAEGTEGM